MMTKLFTVGALALCAVMLAQAKTDPAKPLVKKTAAGDDAVFEIRDLNQK